MVSDVEHVWETMRTAEMKNCSTYTSRVNDLLRGSTPTKYSAAGSPRPKTRQKSASKHKAKKAPKATIHPGSPTPDPRQVRDPYTNEQLLTLTPSQMLCPEAVASTLLASWLKNKNGATDGDVRVRKEALHTLDHDLAEVVRRFGYDVKVGEPTSTVPGDNPPNSSTPFLEDVMAILMDDLARTLFKGLTDPAEVCRESAIHAVTLFLDHVPDLTPHLAYLLPVVMARGVPAGSLYDPELQFFVHDAEDHAAYKRGKATERQDRHIPVVLHLVEGSEELRLRLCRLVGRMLAQLMSRGTIGVLRPYLDDTILYLVTQFRDPYPAVKVEALEITKRLVLDPHSEQGMKFYAVGVARATLPHLRHRHAKVRLAAIDALWMTVKVPDRAKVKGAGTAAIVDLVGFREENVLPVAAFYGRGDTTVNYLAELATDQSVAVRERTIAMLGNWLTTLPDRYDHQTRLLPYVLNAISDEAKAVSTIAIETLSVCGMEYESEHQDDVIERRQFGVDGDVRANHTKPPPPPFLERPRIGARLYVRSNTRRFLMPLLVELSNWISRTRLQSAMLFRTLIVYCEEHLTVDTHKLIPHLQRALDLAFSEKDRILETVLLDCCELIGRYVVPESHLPHMLSRIREEPEVNPTGSRAVVLVILRKFVEGAVPKVLLGHIPGIVDAVTARCEDIAGEVAPVRCATIGVLRAVADALRGEGRQAVVEATYLGTGRLSSLERPVLASAKYLLVCGRLGDVSSDIDSCWDDLAAVGDAGDAAALVTGHAKKLVESASAEYPIGPAWSRTCSPHLCLEGFLFMCPQAPRTCPEILPPLIDLCDQIVNKIDNFAETDREAVLVLLVAPVVTRIITVWVCVKNDEPKTVQDYDSTVTSNAWRLINLCLDTCWGTNPRLRRAKTNLLVAFAENDAGGHFLSSNPDEAPAAVEQVLTAIVDLLGHRQKSSEDTCTLLTLISLTLRTLDLEKTGCRNNARLTPFAKRKTVGCVPKRARLLHADMATRAYQLVLARLDDTSEDVRLRALEALGTFLLILPPDEAIEQDEVFRAAQDLQEIRSDSEEGLASAENDINVVDAISATFLYTPFLEACITRAMATKTQEFGDQLDTLLRRAAGLDPSTFVAVLTRFAGVTRPGRQMLFDLIDHGSLITTLQQGFQFEG